MIFGRRPACVASGATVTRSPSVMMWTSAREVVKILLGKVCAHVLSVFREGMVELDVPSAPLVHGSVIASLNALPRCAAAFPSPRNGGGKKGGFTSMIRWEKGKLPIMA